MQSLFKQLKIEKVYELLFPEKKKGLAVIWLYERMKNCLLYTSDAADEH